MLRITDKSQNGKPVLLLEGQLVGPWVGELSNFCTKIGETAKPLNIDLAEVLFADRKGIALLKDLRGRGAVLINASPLLREQLNGG